MALAKTEWPSTPILTPIKDLLSRFYIIGDSGDPNAGRRLGQEVFTPDGQIIVNKRAISGTEELATSDLGILPGVQSRNHTVQKVYTCNEAGTDLMVMATTYWTFKNGQKREAGFAARAIVEGADTDEPRLKLYHGWADPSELMEGLNQQ